MCAACLLVVHQSAGFRLVQMLGRRRRRKYRDVDGQERRSTKGIALAGLRPSDLARLPQQAEQLNRRSPQTLPKVTPHDVESLVQELRVHQIELELQCQELQDAQ